MSLCLGLSYTNRIAPARQLLRPPRPFFLRKFLYNDNYEPLVTEDETINQINTYSAELTWNKTAVWLGAVVPLKGN